MSLSKLSKDQGDVVIFTMSVSTTIKAELSSLPARTKLMPLWYN
jgi:hypothetical protein